MYMFNLQETLIRIYRQINEKHILEITAQVRHFERIEAQKRHGYLV